MNEKENNKAKKFSIILAELIKHHNLTQRGLSKEINIAQPHIARLIRGEHPSPGLEILVKVSGFFGVTIAQLIGDEPIDFTALPTCKKASTSLPKDENNDNGNGNENNETEQPRPSLTMK